MTVQTYEASGELEAPGQLLRASSTLEQFARDGDAAYQMGLRLWDTPFVPMSLKLDRNRQLLEPSAVAANVAAVWLAGAELELSPMQSLQSINIIEGRPALSAMAMRALVQSHGHDIWTVEESVGNRGDLLTVTVTMRGKRKGSDHTEESTWSLERARQAGLLGKNNWRNHPLNMCIARATSEVCRKIAADVLLGLGYSSEELSDDAGAVGGEVRHQVRAASRRKDPEPEGKGEPERDDDPVPAEGEQVGRPVEDVELPDAEEQAARAREESQQSVERDEDPICGEAKKGDDRRVCSREPDHEGRHHFGKILSDAELAARREAEKREPIAPPEETAPELREGLADPETKPEQPVAQCDAVHPELGYCQLPKGHEGQHQPRNAPAQEPEAPAESSAEDGEGLFPEVTDEELNAAYEADQAAAAAAQGAQSHEEPVDAEVVSEDPPAAPASSTSSEPSSASSDPGEEDDPWADFD